MLDLEAMKGWLRKAIEIMLGENGGSPEAAEARGIEPSQAESDSAEQSISGLARITATSSHTIVGVSQEETATNSAEQREGAANSRSRPPGRPKSKLKDVTPQILGIWVSLGRPEVVGNEVCDRIAEKLLVEKPDSKPRSKSARKKLRARIRATISRHRSSGGSAA
jgi:hypothetical protein